jgi:hypothetical protein
VYKKSQTLHVLFGQGMPNGLLPSTPEEPLVHVMTLYGALATIQLRRHHLDQSGTLKVIN